MAGWGSVAFPGPRNGFWVYTFGPMFGAPVGGLLYDLLLKKGHDSFSTLPMQATAELTESPDVNAATSAGAGAGDPVSQV